MRAFVLYFSLTIVINIISINSGKAQITCESNQIKNYVEQYKELAIEQMVRFKIPASVTLAQAIKESSCGTSELASKSNNHFGIKCHLEWGGNSVRYDDDSTNECFRKYDKIEDSFLDHSMFLVSRYRYNSLFELKIQDYVGWCLGLKSAGYATAPNYANDLLYIIETYQLYEYDNVNVMPIVNLNHKLKSETEPSNILNSPCAGFEEMNPAELISLLFNLPTKKENPIFASLEQKPKRAE